MDIKLRARLSAYSKVDSISSSCDHQNVSKEQIDELFKNMDQPSSVTKTEIDELFDTSADAESVSKSEIDSLFSQEDDTVVSVSYKEIDSLFR